MTQGTSDAVAVLRWGVRRYFRTMLAVAFIVSAVIPLALLALPTTYTAEALVVAQRLDLSLVALPRYAEATFHDGEVARRVVFQFGDAGDLEDIVPNRVSLRAEQDSVVLHVSGHDPNPETAAAIANLAAETFTTALNSPGEGVGAFAIQSRAVPPVEPVEQIPALPYTFAIGIAAGAILGLTVVSLILVVRRPVLQAGDAERLTGVAVVGTVLIPRAKRRIGRQESARDIGGLVAVCRRMIALHAPAIRMVSTTESEADRHRLTAAIAELVGPPAKPEPRPRPRPHPNGTNGSVRHPAPAAGQPGHPGHNGRGPGLVILGPAHPLDLAAVPDVVTVLVVTEGTSAASLEAAVIEHLDGGGPARLLMVRKGKRRSPQPYAGMPESDSPEATVAIAAVQPGRRVAPTVEGRVAGRRPF